MDQPDFFIYSVKKRTMQEKIATLETLAGMVRGETRGRADIEIRSVADLDGAGPADITFVARRRDIGRLSGTQAAAAVVPREVSGDLPLPVIAVADPYLAIAVIHNFFLERPFAPEGVHPTCVIGQDCRIAGEIAMAPLCVLGDRVRIGARTRLHPGVKIGSDVIIGDDCEVHANVVIGGGAVIGNRVIIHAGAVIGADGFGYATDRATGRHVKRPQVGTVEIEDDVEIGANSCVDRATFGKTLLRRGCKIDNLVQIAHNVEVGEDCLVVAQAGISGSTVLGRHVILGGQAGVAGHLRLGDGVMAGAKAGVHNTLPAGTVVSGYPAFDHKQWLRACSVQPKLPQIAREVRRLNKKIDALTQTKEADS